MPNTLSKVDHFCGENGEISPIYMDIMLVKYINLITLGGGLLENKHVPYEGLVIEASNAKNAVFSSKTQPLQPNASILKQTKTPIFTWIIAKFHQNPYINATT